MAGRLIPGVAIAASVVSAQFSLTNTLTQWQTNGASVLGSLEAPTLPPFLKTTPLPGGYPWGKRTVACSHPTYDMPDTCVTRSYDFTISRGTLSPDGVSQEMILVNGQFPGPLIEANWGDWIEVTVHNEIWGPAEGTSMHWHGLHQRGTPWFDGVPTVGQCPIPSGSSLTYKFRADEYGTSWYHAHYSAQYTAGIIGPMVIYGPVHYEYDVDLGPVVLLEWYHEDYENIVSDVMLPGPGGIGVRPHADSNLIQGKGYYPCINVTNGAACGNAGLATFQFVSGWTHKMRLVNTGGEAFLTVSIDNHTMTVVANDFTPVEPYKTTFVTLGIGQRTDILVEATGEPGEAYWFRSWNNICGDSKAPDGMAVIFYEQAETTLLPTTIGYSIPNNTFCLNDHLTLTKPVYQIPVSEPDITVTVTMTHGNNATNSTLWYMNNVAFEGDYNDPPLLDATIGVTTFPPARNIYNLGENTTVRLIFYNTFLSGHPMHIHGHAFQVLAEGFGKWNGSIVNKSNPQRRDVQQNAGGANASNPAVGSSYTVFQWTQDNPGVWPFHCHIAWHLSAGMNILLLERPHDVADLTLPQSIVDNCAAWSTYTSNNAVDQLDSGLRKRSKVEKAMDEDTFMKSRSTLLGARLDGSAR